MTSESWSPIDSDHQHQRNCNARLRLYQSDGGGRLRRRGFLLGRTSHAQLDQRLYQAFKSWLQADWPFEAVAYPGRELTWDEVESLKS